MDAREPSIPHRWLAQRISGPRRRLLRLVHRELSMGQRPPLLHRRNAKNALPRRLEAPTAASPIRRQRQLRDSLRRRDMAPARAGGKLRRPNGTAHLEREDENPLSKRLRGRQLFPRLGNGQRALEGSADVG